jgi:hypothetical protein
MTAQISQRGKEYLKTAETLLPVAKTMTDQAIAGRLEALVDDFQRRAERASHVDAAKALARSAPDAEREWRHDQMSGITAEPAGMGAERWMPGAAQSRVFIPSLPQAELQSCG